MKARECNMQFALAAVRWPRNYTRHFWRSAQKNVSSRGGNLARREAEGGRKTFLLSYFYPLRGGKEMHRRPQFAHLSSDKRHPC